MVKKGVRFSGTRVIDSCEHRYFIAHGEFLFLLWAATHGLATGSNPIL